MARKRTKSKPLARGITRYEVDPAAEWVDYKGQSVPSLFHAETTLDYELEDDFDENGDEVGAAVGLFRPYERISYAFTEGVLSVARYEVIPWEGAPVTDASVRDRGMLEEGRRGLDRLARGAGDGWDTLGEPESPGILSARRARRRVLDSIETPARGGRPGLAPDEVRRVAEVYLAAVERGDSPALAVMDSEGLSRDQANRRIKRARERGLIPAYEREGQS